MKTSDLRIHVLMAAIFILALSLFAFNGEPQKEIAYEDPMTYQLAFNDTCRYTVDTTSRKVSSSTNSLITPFKNNHKIVYFYASAAVYISTDPSFVSNATDYIPGTTLFSNWPTRATRFFTNYYIKAVDTSAAVTYRIRIEGY